MISVIIPCYNSESTIARCLDKVLNYDVEVIVVDDASNDKSGEIIRQYPVKYIKNKFNLGAAASRNIGEQNAQGDILVFIDSDVEINGYTIEQILYNLEGNIAVTGIPSKEVTYPNLCSVHFNRRIHFNYQLLPDYIEIVYGSIFALRKKDYVGFDNTIIGVEDSEFGYRLSKKGKIYHDKNLVIKHWKNIGLLGLLQNDFKRTIDRIKLARGKHKVKSAIKEGRFYSSPLSQMLSPFMAIVTLCSIWNICLFGICLMLFLVLNLDYIKSNDDFTLRRKFQLYWLLLLDMIVVFCAICYGFTKGETYC